MHAVLAVRPDASLGCFIKVVLPPDFPVDGAGGLPASSAGHAPPEQGLPANSAGQATLAQEVPAPQPPTYETVYYYQPVLQYKHRVGYCAVHLNCAPAWRFAMHLPDPFGEQGWGGSFRPGAESSPKLSDVRLPIQGTCTYNYV